MIRLVHLKPHPVEQHRDGIPHGCIVVDHQNAHDTISPGAATLPGCFACSV
jgi:hypothetical protein